MGISSLRPFLHLAKSSLKTAHTIIRRDYTTGNRLVCRVTPNFCEEVTRVLFPDFY